MLFATSFFLALRLSLVLASHHNGRNPHPAGLVPRQVTNTTHRLLVGSAGSIQGFEFNGNSFNPSTKANFMAEGKTFSWMAFKEPNLLYATDENSNEILLFNYDPRTGDLSEQIGSFGGSTGVVHLALNDDRTRLLSSSYGEGTVDIWDSTSNNGTLALLSSVALPDYTTWNDGTQHKAHQAVLDPSNRFFVVNDLAGDSLHVLDVTLPKGHYPFTNNVAVIPRGSGPRHGAFISLNSGSRATHYVVLCETANALQLFSLEYSDVPNRHSQLQISNATLRFTAMQTISSFDPDFTPANTTNARAGELLVSRTGGAVNIYVTNRLTGNISDHIARFTLEARSKNDSTPQLVFKEVTASRGFSPRMLSFSTEGQEEIMFVANVNGKTGLVAIDRVDPNGKMAHTALATWAHDKGDGFGPQFVLQI